MKNTIIIALTVLFLVVGPVGVMAGMNHQPHNVKTYMGKDRKEMVQTGHQHQAKSDEKLQKKTNSIHQYRKMKK